MHKDFYVEFADRETARVSLTEIDRRIGDKWDEPRQHPFEKSVLIAWNLSCLKKCDDLLDGYRRLTYHEAVKRGYPMGYHNGKFHQAAQKIEDAAFVLDAIKASDKVPNFPACRALFYGYQAALYAAINALRGSCQKIGGDAEIWWKEKNRKLREEAFVQSLIIDYNTDKHGSYTGLLSSRITLFEYNGPLPDMFSGEGLYSISNKGTPRERRVFHAGALADFEPYLKMESISLDGVNLDRLSLFDQLEFVLWYFQDLLFEARSKFDKEVLPKVSS